MLEDLSLPLTPSIRAGALEILREALLSGKFQPGQALSEPALATQMGISRGPVREALLMLAQEGLLVHIRNRGFAVIALTQDDRTAMVRVRVPLEALALADAKERMDSSLIDQLVETKQKMIATYAAGDAAAAARLDLRFHELLWEGSGNVWLAHALRRIVTPFFTYAMMYQSKADERKTALMESQHQAYIDFLKGAGSETADAYARSHLVQYESNHDVR